MTEAVLDASAILAVIFDEPGAERVARHIPGALVSAVNIGEVGSKLADLGMPDETIETIITSLQLTIRPFDLAAAFEVARLRPPTRDHGLSFGDRACLALARQSSLPALTTDNAWRKAARATKISIELVR